MGMPSPILQKRPVRQRPGDGAWLCLRFCRNYARLMVEEHHRAHRLTEGEALCVLNCNGYARGNPLTISRPRGRGRAIAADMARSL